MSQLLIKINDFPLSVSVAVFLSQLFVRMSEKVEKVVLVYVTAPTADDAERISETLVKEGLVACSNVFQIRSLYRWKGKLCREEEWGIILKTRETLVPRVIERIKELHPYELPCILAFPVTEGLQGFLDWIKRETGG